VSLIVDDGGSLDLTGTSADPIELRGVEAIRGHWPKFDSLIDDSRL
jgi:hypothetical protein